MFFMTVQIMAAKSTEPKRPLFKSGDIVYYRNGNKFEQATVDQDQPSRMAKIIWIYYNRPGNRNPHKFKAFLQEVYTVAEYEALKDQPVAALYKKGDALILTEDGESYPVRCERDQISASSDRLYVSGYHLENTWVDIAKLSPAEEVTPAEEVAPVAPVAPVAQTKTVKKLFEKGDLAYLKTPTDYTPVTVTISQRHSKSKKIEVLSFGRKIDVLVKDLITVAKYQEITGDNSPVQLDKPRRLFQAGDWCYWQARPGNEPHNKRIVKCDHNQHKNDHIVWVVELKGNWRDRFGVDSNLLGLITDPAKLAELDANEKAIEARVDEIKRKEATDTEVALADVIPIAETVADAIPATETAIAEVAAVAGPPECYPDGIRRDSAIGRIRAEDERAIAAMLKAGDRRWWRASVGNYRYACVEKDQKSPTSKKVQILHWRDDRPGVSPEGVGPVWVNISDLLTEEQYKEQKQNEAKKRVEALLPARDEETPAESVTVAFTSPESFAKVMLKAGNNAGEISRLCDRLLALPMFDRTRINERTKLTRLGPYSRALEAEIKQSGFELIRHTNAVVWRRKDGSEQLRHYYYKLVGLMDYDWDADNQKAAEKVIAKLDNQVANIDSETYIKTVETLLWFDDPIKVLGGLVGASGRRIVELITLGNFTEIENQTDRVVFHGQAKKRDKPSDPYEIYLLGCTAKDFLAKLDFVRDSDEMKAAYEGLDPDSSDFLKRLSDRLRVQVNREAVGPAFEWLQSREGEERATTKTLRSTWAAVVTSKYCPPETNPLLFTSRLLGHFTGSVESMADTLNYIDSVAAKSDEPNLEKVEEVQRWQSIVDGIIVKQPNATSGVETATAETIQDPTETEEEATPALDYVQFVEDEAGDRHKRDFYESPVWASLAMLEYGGITGTVGECCNGYGAISRIFQKANYAVWTNDIDPEKPADHHIDATVEELWDSLPDADWIISNPPYGKLSAPIVINAFKKAKKGIAMVLKMNWWELCQDRKQFLKEHPPTGFINLPRYCYRKATATGKWATDEAPTVIYIWDKSITHGLTQTIPLPADELRLFYRTPDETPELEKIETEIADIMAKKLEAVKSVEVKPTVTIDVAESKPIETIKATKTEPVETDPASVPKVSRKAKEVKPKKPRLTMEEKLEKVSEKMRAFLEKNAALEKPDRWFVSQNIIARVAGVGHDLANEWLNLNKPLLDAHNLGLNRSEQNRGRKFENLN